MNIFIAFIIYENIQVVSLDSLVFPYQKTEYSNADPQFSGNIYIPNDSVPECDGKSPSPALIRMIKKKLPKLCKYFKSEFKSFHLRKFKCAGSGPAISYPFSSIKKEEIYKRHSIFSPDSSKYLDCFSLNMDLYEDSLGRVIGGPRDIDEYDLVVNLKDSSAGYLQFCYMWPLEAFWIDNNTLIIFYDEEWPSFYIYNAEKHHYVIYAFPEMKQGEINFYEPISHRNIIH